MIIVGFTYKTSKILPRIFCRRFRHCAPIVINANGKMQMYQFVRRNNIAKIDINMRDVRLLRAHGWVFICLPCVVARRFCPRRARTCVALTCDIMGLRGPRPITPYGLFRKLKKSPCGDFLMRNARLFTYLPA